MLSTPIALKADRIATWIHHTQACLTDSPSDPRGLDNHMAGGQGQKQSFETQIAKLVVLIVLPLTGSCSSSNTPHQPYALTGIINNAPMGDIL